MSYIFDLLNSLITSFSLAQFNSVTVVPDSLWPHGLQHARPPCPSPIPRVYSNSCPLSWWYHPSISSSVIPFSSHLQSFPASGSFPVSQLFVSGGQSIGVSASASVLPMNIQDWFPLGNLSISVERRLVSTRSSSHIANVDSHWDNQDHNLTAEPLAVQWMQMLMGQTWET